MTHASSPAAAMVGERARLLEPRAEGGDKPRGSAFRASVALVAMLAVSAIAAFGMLRSPEDVAVSPLGVSLEDEATLQSVLNAHEPRMAATASNEGLSLGDLEDMAALLGQQHPAGDSASEVAESAEEESFETGLLEYPHYTRPQDWQGRLVPDVLLSGHHENIRQWRRAQAEAVTKERRPDLWAAYAQDKH